MPRVLVTGAGRGIGLEFARQYAADGWDVIATVREPLAAAALRKLGIRVEPLDMRDFDAVAAFPARLAGAPLDLFVANAGISKAKLIRSAEDAKAWQEVHAVNAVAPTGIAKSQLRGPKSLGLDHFKQSDIPADAFRHEFEWLTPLRHLPAPEEYGPLYAYLASRQNVVMTGQTVLADSGTLNRALMSQVALVKSMPEL